MNDALASLAVIVVGSAALLFLALEIVFQVGCVSRVAEAGRARILPPSLWTIFILLIPVLGGMLYLGLGRDR